MHSQDGCRSNVRDRPAEMGVHDKDAADGAVLQAPAQSLRTVQSQLSPVRTIGCLINQTAVVCGLSRWECRWR